MPVPSQELNSCCLIVPLLDIAKRLVLLGIMDFHFFHLPYSSIVLLKYTFTGHSYVFNDGLRRQQEEISSIV